MFPFPFADGLAKGTAAVIALVLSWLVRNMLYCRRLGSWYLRSLVLLGFVRLKMLQVERWLDICSIDGSNGGTETIGVVLADKRSHPEAGVVDRRSRYLVMSGAHALGT